MFLETSVRPVCFGIVKKFPILFQRNLRSNQQTPQTFRALSDQPLLDFTAAGRFA